MGRELKRVSLGFDAPLNEVWKGYLNPHYKKCPDCENGYTAGRVRLNDLINLLMLSGSDAAKGKNHQYFKDMKRTVNGFNESPSPDLAELTTGLCGRKPDDPFGYDVSDNWRATDKIIKAARLPKKWGYCPTCNGEAIDPEIKQKYNEWKDIEPPPGEGYQLWSTTTEGTPLSPVFDTLEKLCAYCEDNCTVFGYSKTSKENWYEMLSEGKVMYQEGNIIFI